MAKFAIVRKSDEKLLMTKNAGNTRPNHASFPMVPSEVRTQLKIALKKYNMPLSGEVGKSP